LTISNQTSPAYPGISIWSKLLDAVPDILSACLQRFLPFFFRQIQQKAVNIPSWPKA